MAYWLKDTEPFVVYKSISLETVLHFNIKNWFNTHTVGYFILNYLAWFVHLWMNNTMMLLLAAPHSHTPNPINIEFAFCMVWGLLYRGDCTLSTECPGITSALWLPPKHRSVQICQHWTNMTTWFKLKQKHYSTNKTKTEPPTKKWIYPTKNKLNQHKMVIKQQTLGLHGDISGGIVVVVPLDQPSVATIFLSLVTAWGLEASFLSWWTSTLHFTAKSLVPFWYFTQNSCQSMLTPQTAMWDPKLQTIPNYQLLGGSERRVHISWAATAWGCSLI